jgi:uncharacterized protein involved in exopolysaccharide biosynthesis
MPEQIKVSDLLALVNKVIKYLLSQYKLIGITTTITCLIAIGYWYQQTPIYRASSTFIVEEGSSKGGGLSGIASQFGIDIGSMMGGGGSGMFSGENIYEIMKSRLIIEKVLLSKIDSSEGAKGKSMADLYMQISGMQKALNKKGPEFAKLNFTNLKEDSKHTILQDSILNVLVQKIVTQNLTIDKQNKKTSIITVSLTSSDQVFSKVFVEKLLIKTSELYIDIKTRNLSKNINKIQRKADSLQYSLNNIYDRSYINLSRPQEATNRDKTVTYTLYGEVIKNLETLKISLINQTPLIQVLDLPQYPLIDQKYRLLVLLPIGFIVGVLLSSLIAIFLYTEKEKI